jgi:hypothetical protein
MDIPAEVIQTNLKRIINQVYKLLPMREEGGDWIKPLSTLMEELTGMSYLLDIIDFFPLLCKLEGLFVLVVDKDFVLFRRTVFECLNLLNEVNQDVERQS